MSKNAPPEVLEWLKASGYVAHRRADWEALATKANDHGRLTSTCHALADQLDREASAGPEYREIRHAHARRIRAVVTGHLKPSEESL